MYSTILRKDYYEKENGRKRVIKKKTTPYRKLILLRLVCKENEFSAVRFLSLQKVEKKSIKQTSF